jgi:hypothetical protein
MQLSQRPVASCKSGDRSRPRSGCDHIDRSPWFFGSGRSLGKTVSVVVVAVELAPEPAPEIAQAAIDGCNGALGAESCELTQRDRANASEFHALVHSDPARPGVFIVELRRHTRSGRLLETRELRFAEYDTSLQRSSSLGVVIAALVVAQGRRERAQPVAPPPPPPPAPPRPVARAEPRPPPRSLPARIDAGVSLTRALEERSLALGGLIRLSLAFEPSPLFASIGGGYESALGAEPQLAWSFGTLGLGARAVPGPPLSLELRAELMVQRVAIEAWRAGGRFGVDGVWSWSARLGLIGGAQVSLLRPSVVIDVRDQPVERAPTLSGGFFLGFRYSP